MWFHFFILASLLSTQVYALESTDVMKVNVLKSYDQNVLALNRGLEDGIVVGDHMKLVNQAGYISRGICIKSELLFSHWRIYRLVNPEMMSLDFRYTLIGLNQSEIPEDVLEKSKALVNKSYQYDDITKRNFDKAVILQQKRITRSDLPSDVKKDRLFKEVAKTDTDRFVERNFSKSKLRDDFSTLYLSLRASPFTTQTFNNQRNLNYGFNVSNNNSEKYIFNLDFNKIQSRQEDYQQNAVTIDRTDLITTFDLNRVFENLSLFMFAQYNQLRIGELFNPRQRYEFGFLGIKAHLYEGDSSLKKVNLSYITTINSVDFDRINSFTNPTVENVNERRIRHSFRLELDANFSNEMSFSTNLFWRPRYLLDENQVDFDDSMTDWNSFLKYKLNRSFDLSFNYQYLNDINIKRQFPNLSSINQISSLNIHYNFQL